jgi:hypothetical protein
MITTLQPYRAALLGFVVLALMALSAGAAWQWQENAYGKQLADQSAVMAHTQAELARAAAMQLRAQQEKRLALESRLSESDAKHYQELTNAQKTSGQLAADLAAARRGLSVRTTRSACRGGVPGTAAATGMDDGAGDRAFIHPEDAAALARITGDADICAVKLGGLQEWARSISKTE